jgi:hypothetical protein
MRHKGMPRVIVQFLSNSMCAPSPVYPAGFAQAKVECAELVWRPRTLTYISDPLD